LRSRQRRVDRRRREALDRLVDLKGTKYYGLEPLTHSWLALLPLAFPAGLSMSSRALGLGATCVQEALGSFAGSGRWFTRTAYMPNHLLPSSRRGSRSGQLRSRRSLALIGFSARSQHKVILFFAYYLVLITCLFVGLYACLSFFLTHLFQCVVPAEDVFEEVKPILRSALDGHNVCILAYGQTGTGKTYTMFVGWSFMRAGLAPSRTRAKSMAFFPRCVCF
jgi:hypothetical protein